MLWPHAAPPHPALGVCVVVPVRNEAAGLTATLVSLLEQKSASGDAFDRQSYEVLLLANNCGDGSAGVAQDFARRHPDLALHVAEVNLPLKDAHIGHVRKLLMDEACRRLARAGAWDGTVASTDGDTVVAPHWLAATQQAFLAPVGAVAGRILLDATASMGAQALRRQRCDTAYRLAQVRLETLIDPDPLDPWPRHHQHFGASLAVSRSAYLHVGGVPPVRYLEDEALVAALRRSDLRVRHSPQVRVTTSARRDGRVEVGLSWQLRQWSEAGANLDTTLVEGAQTLAAALRARRLLRQAWRTAAPPDVDAAAQAVAAGYALSARAVAVQIQAAHAASPFGALWALVQAAGQRADQRRLVRLRQATLELRAAIAALERHQPDGD